MKRRKKAIPVMLLWTKRDQVRFIENVERLSSLINELETLLAPVKRRRAAKTPPAELPNGGAK